MAVEHLNGSRIMTGLLASPVSQAGAGLAGGNVRCWSETVEVTAAASATSTYLLARLPSNARIMGASKIYFDDLASTGSPTLDIGVFLPSDRSSGITNDDDALNDGIDCASAAGSANILKTIDKYGKRLWEHVASQTTDPGGALDIKVTIKDADTNTGGTITVEIYYTLN